MYPVGILLFLLSALFWILHGARLVWGALGLPRLKDFPPAADRDCPRVSLIFAARDEQAKLPRALRTLRDLDYPHLEIIAVNDRSTDSTPSLLGQARTLDPRVKVVNLEVLPEGWLGKPHALERGFEVSSGEWLLFTDA